MGYYIDRELTNQEWFQELEPNNKLLLWHIQHECSYEGLWTVNASMASFKLKIEVDLDKFIKAVNKEKENVIVCDDGKKFFYAPWIRQQFPIEDSKVMLKCTTSTHNSCVKNLRRYAETSDWLERAQSKGEIIIVNDPKYSLDNNITDNIKERDDYNCAYCHNKFTKKILHIDHVFPTSKGGTNSSYNLVSACKECNTKKSNKNPLQYLQENNITPTGRLVENLKYLIHHEYLKGDLANRFTDKFGTLSNRNKKPSKGLNRGESEANETQKRDKEATKQTNERGNLGYKDKDKNQNKDKNKLYSSSNHSNLNNKPPTPLERPDDLKEFIKHYGKNSEHKYLLKYWSEMSQEEKGKALSAVKKLTTDIQFRKNPFYYLRDKDFELPAENKQVYTPPKTSGKERSPVDYEKAKERLAREAEEKRRESLSTNSLGANTPS